MIETAATHRVYSNALADDERVDLLGSTPFLFMHGGAIASLLTGVRWMALAACFVTLWLHMFGITAAAWE